MITPTHIVKRPLVIVGSLLGLAVLVLTFIGGMWAGRVQARGQLERLTLQQRQLTENLDKPIKERPLLRQLPGPLRKALKQHGTRGSIVEVADDALVINTADGARSITLTDQTKIVAGKERVAAERSELTAGRTVTILSRQPKGEKSETSGDQLEAALVIIEP